MNYTWLSKMHLLIVHVNMCLVKKDYTFIRSSMWLRCQRICLQCRRPGFSHWVGKILWSRTWQPTPVLLPGESPWTEEPGGPQPTVSQRVGHDWATKHAYIYTPISAKCLFLQHFFFYHNLISMWCVIYQEIKEILVVKCIFT